MKKPYDMYDKIAKEENVQRQQVKLLGLGIMYSIEFKGDLAKAEAAIKRTVQMAKKNGVI